jgi:sugar lactone lactonase YvrE
VVGDAELVLDARADLGEAPSWDADARQLIWVDITNGLVHRFDPGSERDEVFEIGQPVGAAVATSSGRIALAANSGFLVLDPATGRLDPVADVETDVTETMMNDGKCDPAGRFWAGTKDVEGGRALGSLYRLDADHRLTRVLTDVTISNGLGWSPDARTMYYIDSTTYRIDAFDYDVTSGAVSNRRPLIETPKSWGLPDGMTVDQDGFLWVAFWGGSAVRRIAPDGRVDVVVRVPVTQVTSCAFGGPDLADLFVTSARSGLTDAALSEQPLAGGLFRVRPGVRGLPSPPFAG